MKERGFTLFELLVTLAIILLLFLFALPNYRDVMAKPARAQASVALMSNALWLARFYNQNGSYLYDRKGNPPQLPYTDIKDNNQIVYTISLDRQATTQHRYNLIAQPVNALRADRCGRYVISDDGSRRNSATLDTQSFDVIRCWP